jgi:hypothetical protein
LFGQGCLLARRLLEAGVALVTVYWHYEGPDDSPVWDTHENNFKHLKQRLAPPADQAFATLLEDLSTRGLLSDTLVVCMGEFGRSPRVNSKGGQIIGRAFDPWSWPVQVYAAAVSTGHRIGSRLTLATIQSLLPN